MHTSTSASRRQELSLCFQIAALSLSFTLPSDSGLAYKRTTNGIPVKIVGGGGYRLPTPTFENTVVR